MVSVVVVVVVVYVKKCIAWETWFDVIMMS